MATATVPVNLTHAGPLVYFQFTGSGTIGDPFSFINLTATIGDVIVEDGITSRPTITISAAPDYSVGDDVGGIVTLAAVNASTGRPVELKTVTLKDKNGQAPALTLYFLRSTPLAGTYTDNAALVWGATDPANVVGIVRVLATDWITQAGESFVSFGDIGQIMTPATTDVFLLIVADAIWNAASTSDLTAEISFHQK